MGPRSGAAPPHPPRIRGTPAAHPRHAWLVRRVRLVQLAARSPRGPWQVLYELLCLERPYVGESVLSLAYKVCQDHSQNAMQESASKAAVTCDS